MAHAQDSGAAVGSGPFAAKRWHLEFGAHASLEAWNYNTSHEELYGLTQAVTYGLRDGLVLIARQRTFYVSQRLNDTVVLGATTGLRARLIERGRVSAFVQGEVGVSSSAIATPQRGTRFNYLALGAVGALVRLRPRLHLVTTVELLHLSNASLRGPGRNPDIEAIGPTIGLIVGF